MRSLTVNNENYRCKCNRISMQYLKGAQESEDLNSALLVVYNKTRTMLDEAEDKMCKNTSVSIIPG